MKLPLKTRMLQFAIQHEKEFTLPGMMKALEPEYGGEKMFNYKQMDEYFDSYMGVGFFSPTLKEFDSNGNLVIHCKVTEYGKSRGKYI